MGQNWVIIVVTSKSNKIADLSRRHTVEDSSTPPLKQNPSSSCMRKLSRFLS
jgi:hypothetical protein